MSVGEVTQHGVLRQGALGLFLQSLGPYRPTKKL